MANETIDVEFTVRMVIRNAIDRDALSTDYSGDLLGYVRMLTTEEGLQGCTDDDYNIIDARELPREGSITVGCDPERARQVHAVFADETARSMAELEDELAKVDSLPELPDDGMTPLERWLS